VRNVIAEGDRVKVQVIDHDLERKRINLKLIDVLEKAASKAPATPADEGDRDVPFKDWNDPECPWTEGENAIRKARDERPHDPPPRPEQAPLEQRLSPLAWSLKVTPLLGFPYDDPHAGRLRAIARRCIMVLNRLRQTVQPPSARFPRRDDRIHDQFDSRGRTVENERKHFGDSRSRKEEVVGKLSSMIELPKALDWLSRCAKCNERFQAWSKEWLCEKCRKAENPEFGATHDAKDAKSDSDKNDFE